jgi:hypothetical protein
MTQAQAMFIKYQSLFFYLNLLILWFYIGDIASCNSL